MSTTKRRLLILLAAGLVAAMTMGTFLPHRRAAFRGGVAVDATSEAIGSGASTLTWSHTAAGTNRALVVLIGSTSNVTITGVTFNGVAMTELWDRSYVSVLVGAGYVLAAPDAGTYDIVVTASGTAELGGWAISLTGVNQTTPNREAYSGVEAFVTVANAQSGDFVVDSTSVYNGGTLSVTGGRTAIGTIRQTFYGNARQFGAAYIAATGSTACTWTTAAAGFVSGGVAIVPAP